MGMTRRHRISNTIIRAALKVELLMRKIIGAQQRWFGPKFQRLCVTCYPRMALEVKVKEIRPRGRRRDTRTDNIRVALAERNYTWVRALQVSQDR